MGITSQDIKLIELAISKGSSLWSVLELGSQNLYTGNEKYPPFASTWYKAQGLDYDCIDLAGDNGAIVEDLAHPIKSITRKYGLVTDFGTSEHVVQMEKHSKVAFHEGHINSIYPDGVKDIDMGFYNCWLNKHRLLHVGGLMINVNPKTGHWPGHGYSYYTRQFYTQLVEIAEYRIVHLDEQAAMGNWTDGVNVCCILEKTGDRFPSFNEFMQLDFRKS